MRGSIAVVLLAVSVLALGLVTAPPADAASRIQIVRVNYDPPGPDRGHNAALNAEWVKFRNVSRVPVRMTGFTLRDRANHRYRFGPTTVMPGKSITVHTGKGKNNPWHRYWGRGFKRYVWNNTGDRATLLDARGRALDSCSWGRSSRGWVNC